MPVPASSVPWPTRVRNDGSGATAFIPARSGTASASVSSRCTPAGSALRSIGIEAAVPASMMRRRKLRTELSHATECGAVENHTGCVVQLTDDRERIGACRAEAPAAGKTDGGASVSAGLDRGRGWRRRVLHVPRRLDANALQPPIHTAMTNTNPPR